MQRRDVYAAWLVQTLELAVTVRMRILLGRGRRCGKPETTSEKGATAHRHGEDSKAGKNASVVRSPRHAKPLLIFVRGARVADLAKRVAN
jgi:hypothetical protein